MILNPMMTWNLWSMDDETKEDDNDVTIEDDNDSNGRGVTNVEHLGNI